MTNESHSFAVPEEVVLERAAHFEGLIIVDLDETLYLRNSTADFLDTACPGILAALILRMLDLVAPWNWFGGSETRDLWQVRIIASAFPWTFSRWERRCKATFSKNVNARLLNVLRARHQKFVVATLGYEPIARLLLSSIGCADIELIACQLDWGKDRKCGKSALIEARLGESELSRAMFVTDSLNDIATLEKCALPCFTKWEQASYDRALSRIYLPGDYVNLIKKPHLSHAFRRVLKQNLILWMIAATTSEQFQPSTIIALIPLFLSFWCIYEIGYFDNDKCAVLLEDDPMVKDAFFKFDARNFEVKAWSAAVLFFAAFLTLSRGLGVRDILTWLCVLIALRAAYFVYNRYDKGTRAWLYLLLQTFRGFAFASVVPIGSIGAMACAAHIIAVWLPYYIYRYLRKFHIFEFPILPVQAIRFFVLLVIVIPLLTVDERENVFHWSTALVFAWALVLARKDLRAIARKARWIGKR